jgi:hypothetical protein
MTQRAKGLKAAHEDPEMGLAERLPYLSKPLRSVSDAEGEESILLSMPEFRQLMYHLRTLITLAKSMDDETISMEEFVPELRASGRLPAGR